ncbi:RPB5 subunit of DNA-directed RNA polymerase [Conidiobolus coronatus NRRL 28638]|uniref:DNA-directed RNA polymerases I, II, and III subunit RPABC1 n=1 Tax=Conidiobolus coronatus (strain ATCC 28846 / CBS 209.66 / NRRL 28638) TaxID=796925 RepID=A0A137PHB6_CONC2|nr:RPB5 subunit of DNA-directed RNA polymerase [Conidiobolus coronatus NRRL 28638]|eukprot:KXN74393.1 RPB5 subunit of DNA-directed RNA polymerase [Conidiobolus coronatus NRRL 28638]
MNKELTIIRSEAEDYLLVLRKRYLNVLQMIKDRGYQLVTGVYENIELKDFTKMVVVANCVERDRLNLLATDTNDNGVYIFFPNDSNIGISSLYKLFRKMSERGCKHGIFINNGKITSASMIAINQSAPKMKIELFDEEFFDLCVIHHELVPEHQILSTEEKDNFLKKHPLPYNNLPIILSCDPVARYYGIEKGQIVKIKRVSLLGGVTDYYRICVNSNLMSLSDSH